VDRHLSRWVFDGHIAGFGSAAGVRFVIGVWAESPLGSFSDVMAQRADGERVLLAPDREIAEFVAATYHFDLIRTGAVTSELSDGALVVSAPGLDIAVTIGGPAPIDRLLRWVPARIATSPLWLRAIDPVAARVMPGVRTAGAAAAGRREYYGVRRSHRIRGVDGTFDGRDLGGLAPLRPPVTFGFSSAPASPQVVRVTTTIDGAAS